MPDRMDTKRARSKPRQSSGHSGQRNGGSIWRKAIAFAFAEDRNAELLGVKPSMPASCHQSSGISNSAGKYGNGKRINHRTSPKTSDQGHYYIYDRSRHRMFFAGLREQPTEITQLSFLVRFWTASAEQDDQSGFSVCITEVLCYQADNENCFYHTSIYCFSLAGLMWPYGGTKAISERFQNNSTIDGSFKILYGFNSAKRAIWSAWKIHAHSEHSRICSSVGKFLPHFSTGYSPTC